MCWLSPARRNTTVILFGRPPIRWPSTSGRHRVSLAQSQRVRQIQRTDDQVTDARPASSLPAC